MRTILQEYSSRDFVLLNACYEIAKHIESETVKSPFDEPGEYNKKLLRHTREVFSDGPDPYRNQMKSGLVLEYKYGSSFYIHSPFGEVTIPQSGSEKTAEILKAMRNKGLLGLEEHSEYKGDQFRNPVKRWAITNWKGFVFESHVYRDPKDYIPFEEVKGMWEKNFKTLPVVEARPTSSPQQVSRKSLNSRGI